MALAQKNILPTRKPYNFRHALEWKSCAPEYLAIAGVSLLLSNAYSSFSNAKAPFSANDSSACQAATAVQNLQFSLFKSPPSSTFFRDICYYRATRTFFFTKFERTST
jgi:hypothetical protein